MNTGPELIRPAETGGRNWMPLAIAAGVVIVAAAVAVFVLERGRSASGAAPVNAAVDPYAASLPLTNLSLSESSNLAGGKVTYLDGHIANKGARTVTAISVQVLFRNPAHEVAQNDPPQPMMIIRSRDPYIDTEPVSAAPLRPGDERDFRLSFDQVTPSWDGALPEVRILRVQSQ